MTGDNSQDPHDKARRIAFTRAFHEHGNYILRYFYRRTSNIHAAKDLAQQFWLSVYKRFDVAKMSELRLLQRRATDIYVAYVRQKATRAFVSFTDEVPEAFAPEIVASPPEERRLQEDFWDKFKDADLTEEQKRAFWMKARIGNTLEEISRELSVPVSTVQDWSNRVRQECKRCLNRRATT